jgi:hypothetical protein
MTLHLLKLSHHPCCSTFVLIEPSCHHTEEMNIVSLLYLGGVFRLTL